MTPPRATVGRFVIAADHPCLPGHFPGDPIVPGVVLLDEAIALILAHRTGERLGRVVTCKFLAQVRPGDCVDVHADAGNDDELRVSCSVAGYPVIRGVMRLTAST